VTSIPAILPAEVEIHPGEHPEGHFLGMTWNLDTIWVTVVAGLIVCLLGLWARRQLTLKTDDYVPTKLQLVWESVVKEVQTQVEDNLGRVHPYVVPLATALFFFILVANWLEMIPSEPNEHWHFLPAPTADTNLTYAMALTVMIGAWSYGIAQKGARGYFKHFMEPYPFLLPLNIIEEITKPISLALRLFGNIFAGGILLALIGALTAWTLGPAPIGGVLSIFFAIVWKLFDMAIGAIQAFIFALLTVLYFGMASGSGHTEEHDDHEAATDDVTADAPDRTPQPELAA